MSAIAASASARSRLRFLLGKSATVADLGVPPRSVWTMPRPQRPHETPPVWKRLFPRQQLEELTRVAPLRERQPFDVGFRASLLESF